MNEWHLILADLLVLSGTAAMTLAVVAVLRIPATFAKMHATTMAVVLGALVTLAACLANGDLDLAARALLVGAFLLITTPVGAHALARLEKHHGEQRGSSRDTWSR